jgi:hypothetical protein
MPTQPAYLTACMNDCVWCSTVSFGRQIASEASPVADTCRSFFPVKIAWQRESESK